MMHTIEEARQHLAKMESQYASIGPAGMFGLTFMKPLRLRIDAGETSQDLIDEIMELK